MSKKNNNNNIKKSNRNNSYYESYDLPDVINMDDLSYTNDDDLERRYNLLTSEREKVAQTGGDPTAWEIEIAYVQRESKIRSTRRNAHERYVRSNPDASYYVDEANQPQVNVSNVIN